MADEQLKRSGATYNQAGEGGASFRRSACLVTAEGFSAMLLRYGNRRPARL
jgi:hypothetical protein